VTLSPEQTHLSDHSFGACTCTTRKSGLLNKMTSGLEGAMRHSLDAEQTAASHGLLQGLDARIKVASLLALIIAGIACRNLLVLLVIFALAVVLAHLSGIGPRRLARQAWLGVFLFTGAIALPAIFLVPGEAVVPLPLPHWSITLQGIRSAAFLLGRAETSATLAMLLILTTPWPHVLKAFSSLGVPDAVVALMGMTYRYIFVLLRMAEDLMEARRARVLAPMNARARRQMIMSSIGVLLTKSLDLASDIHSAMIARGYRGQSRLLHDFQTTTRDWLFLALALACPAAIYGFHL
jgi:cobalt/nickel transport system permease protein